MALIRRRTLIVLLFLLPVFSGCAGTLHSTPAASPAVFSDAQRDMVLSGSPGEPMTVVFNDNPEGDAILRTPSAPVTPGDPVVEHLISRMLASVNKDKGVGIAAPQVGINRRVVLVQRLDILPEQPFVSYLNPQITEYSEDTAVGWEGCLSIPGGFGKVRRSTAVTVAWDGEDGRRHSERIEGFVAVIFQHEIDHLQGVLFIDRMEPGPLTPEDEYRELRRREKEAQKARDAAAVSGPQTPAP